MTSQGRFLPGALQAATQEAQARLLRIRAERGIEPRSAGFLSGENDALPWTGEGVYASDESAPSNWPLLNAQRELQRRRAAAGPALTGWRDYAQPGPQAAAVPPGLEPLAPEALKRSPQTPEVEAALKPLPATITVHPTMLMAVLRRDLAAPARVWLLLRAMDRAGRGRLDVADVRRGLTGKDAPLRCCGWRRLRQLLAQGEGVFWHRDEADRLWLRGAHRIAHTLDCRRVQGFPVELPVATLLGGIQGVRAAFYAAFHSGRPGSPISRDTLAAISGVPGRTQLAYDRAARVARRRNLAVGERYSAERFREQAWRRGRAVFQFVDTEGRQGRAKGEYVAWHLPNSYEGPYDRRSRGGRKQLNRQLADLVKKGIPGNDGTAVERVFFANGGLAARQYNREPERDAYWRSEKPLRAGGGVWYVIPGMQR